MWLYISRSVSANDLGGVVEHRDSRPHENGMVGVKNPAVHKHLTSLTVSVVFEVTSGLSIIMT